MYNRKEIEKNLILLEKNVSNSIKYYKSKKQNIKANLERDLEWLELGLSWLYDLNNKDKFLNSTIKKLETYKENIKTLLSNYKHKNIKS